MLAELIVRLAGDDAERRELGEAARARVASEYSADRLRAGVEQAYRAALSA
jgi:glycosyltransferase involved in cell wall biosynthesis